MAVMKLMLEAGMGMGLLTADSPRDVQKGSHAFTSYMLVITRWQLSSLFHFCSCLMRMQMSTTGLLLKVVTQLANCMASVLPPHRNKAVKDSLLQTPPLLPQGMVCGGDSPCPLGILTG